nr:cysteine-rich CWC family protein [Bradyrhizobium sp.]
MTNRSETPGPRRLACSACGTEFSCSLAGGCWCADESFRLPLPADASDCLCPDCLRKLAAQQTPSRGA